MTAPDSMTCTWPTCGHTAKGQCHYSPPIPQLTFCDPAAIRNAALREAAEMVRKASRTVQIRPYIKYQGESVPIHLDTNQLADAILALITGDPK